MKIAALLVFFALQASLPAQQEIVAAIQVHGNTLTSSEEIIAAANVRVGEPVSEAQLEEAEKRIRSAGHFEDVQVLKRFAAITDPTQILVVIQVDEGPVRIVMPETGDPNVPGTAGGSSGQGTVVRRSRLNVMFVPILNAEDGYGFTYGGQFAIAGYGNHHRRVVIPASWGGDKRLAVEFQQEFTSRAAPRLRSGGLLQRRTHPFYDADADRKRVWARGEWTLVQPVRAGIEAAFESSSLLGERNEARSIGADVVLDTRVDPLMPYNALFVQASVERLGFVAEGATRTAVDAHGYVGLPRGLVLALRALREDFSRPGPAFYKSMLGGARNLRGFRAGYAVGDTLAAASAEVRVPLTSPLRVARFGVSFFVDAGTTYNKGERLGDQRFERGIGAGLWANAPLFGISVDIARGLGSSTRVHVGAGLTF